MKKLIFVFLLLASRPASAQLPQLVTLGWDANLPADAVTGYNLYDNNVRVSPTAPIPANCTPTCAATINITTAGTHILAVSAMNATGESDYVNCASCKVTITISGLPPGQVKNVKRVSQGSTRVPPNLSITDSHGGKWDLGNLVPPWPLPYVELRLNGTQVGMGVGRLIEICSDTIYAIGVDENYYKAVPAGTTYSWTNLLTTIDPCPQ